MNKKIVVLFFAMFYCANLFAAKKDDLPPVVHESKYSYEYRELAQKLQNPTPPFEKDGLIVFSAKPGPHFVGIAFDFENFQKIHPFQKRIILNENEQQERTWYFYILEEYPQTNKILYRLIIDGLWTTDPMNEKKHYDALTGISLSQIDIEHEYPKETVVAKNANGSEVHFVYQGKSGQNVRLSGTFSNWDSWIYQLKETSRGFYELTLPLAKGTYYYVYYIGTKSFPDATNHERAIKDGGQAVSKLIVD